jgi:Carbohydrate esterase, sialic acid-specific acetylesterase
MVACGGGGGATAPEVQPTSAVCASKRSSAGFDVVLLAGQSNMSGYGAYIVPAFDTTDVRIQQWGPSGVPQLAVDPLLHPDAPFNTGRIGPGMSFARNYLKTLPANRSVLLVPTAFAGTGFSDARWNPGNDLFESAVQRTNSALAADATGNCLAAILWNQGETDVLRNMSAASYQAALDTMITTLRVRLRAGSGADTAPFVLGGFSPDWLALKPTPSPQPIVDVINATPSRLRYTAVVSTSGLTSNVTQGLDGAIHIDAASHRVYGKRFFDALAQAAANSTAR